MRFAILFVLIPLFAACGDKLTSSPRPTIAVLVDEISVPPDGSTSFGQALQQTIARTVSVENTSSASRLRITGVDWAVDEAGNQLKNPYVEIDWRSAVDADSFPWTVDTDNNNALTFAIEYTPPLGKPLDDFSDSVLVISSNAYNDNLSAKVPEFRITFKMSTDAAIPRVTPISYDFKNATQALGEKQQFTIYNDTDLATAPFHITNVYLERGSDEFTLQRTPAAGTVVLAPGDPGYKDIEFDVLYQPKDNIPDTNAIIITTDVGAGGTLRVPLTTSSTRCEYSISYAHENEFDFTNVTAQETRSVQLTCLGPGTMRVHEPEIDPEDAQQDYTVTSWVASSTPGGEDVQNTSWPRGLASGRSIRFDVTWAPNPGSDTRNGFLVIPVEVPDVISIQLPLLSGEPKSKIVVAPLTEIIGVTGSKANGDSGTRDLIVYNEGNGPLEIRAAVIEDQFNNPGKIWRLEGFVPFTVPPNGLEIITVAYDLGEITANDLSETEYLEITYFNDFTGAEVVKSVGLAAADSKGVANPVASLVAAGSGFVAGAPLTLDASGSTASDGALAAGSYLYYLVAKPAGSLAKLNVIGDATAAFVPDIAGSYGVEVVVYDQAAGSYVYSAPASVTVSVGAAP